MFASVNQDPAELPPGMQSYSTSYHEKEGDQWRDEGRVSSVLTAPPTATQTAMPEGDQRHSMSLTHTIYVCVCRMSKDVQYFHVGERVQTVQMSMCV